MSRFSKTWLWSQGVGGVVDQYGAGGQSEKEVDGAPEWAPARAREGRKTHGEVGVENEEEARRGEPSVEGPGVDQKGSRK